MTRRKCRAVDEKREQYKAGCEHRYEALCVLIEGCVLGDPESQHQSQRSAQSAPDDRIFVGGTDRLGEFDEFEQRHEHEQHKGASRECRRYQHRKQQQIMGIDIAEQPWNKDRGEDKNQGAGPKGELVPEVGQERPIVGRDARTAERADGQSGGQHGDDARYMKQALGDDKNAISERQGQSGLREAVVANPLE